MSIALELSIEIKPRWCSLLNTLLVLRDKLAEISSMEFPACRNSTCWFSSEWLHRLLAMTGLGIWASWCSAWESFSIAKRNVSGISIEKNSDFWSANSRFLDSELFIQISTSLTQATTSDQVKTPYTLPVSNANWGFDWASKHPSVKSLYAWCPISSNSTIKITLYHSPIYYNYTTLTLL